MVVSTYVVPVAASGLYQPGRLCVAWLRREHLARELGLEGQLTELTVPVMTPVSPCATASDGTVSISVAMNIRPSVLNIRAGRARAAPRANAGKNRGSDVQEDVAVKYAGLSRTGHCHSAWLTGRPHCHAPGILTSRS